MYKIQSSLFFIHSGCLQPILLLKKKNYNFSCKFNINFTCPELQLTKLESLVHVSTAYCHCGEPVLEEKYYPVPISPEEIMKIVDENPESVVSSMTAKILGDQPNTYAFTKALSEDLIQRSGLPAGIARPSIGKTGIVCNTIVSLPISCWITVTIIRYENTSRTNRITNGKIGTS